MGRVGGWIGVLGAAVLLGACGSTARVSEVEFNHIVAVDQEGRSATGRVGGEPIEDSDYSEQLKRMRVALQETLADGGRENRVFLYFHGGLVGVSGGSDSAKTLRRWLDEDRKAGIYDAHPMFINWDTGPFSSWKYGTFMTLQGRVSKFWAPLTSPFRMVSAAGRALTRLPETLLWQGAQNIGESWSGIDVLCAPDGWEEQMIPATDKADPNVLMGLAQGVVPGALRIVTTPLVDFWGVTAYGDMRRSVHQLFAISTRADLADALGPTAEVPEDGVLERIASMLLEECDSSACNTDATKLRITIAAHSMGAHVVNELLARHPELPVDRVLLLAPACSVGEFATSTVEFVRHTVEDPDRDPCEVFCLSLHPHREVTEKSAFGIAPHGSLLVYIDEYITTHHSPLDRTLGAWNNVVGALPHLEIEEVVRERLHFKMFDWDSKVTSHGEFNDVRFWREEVCWE